MCIANKDGYACSLEDMYSDSHSRTFLYSQKLEIKQNFYLLEND